MQYFKDWRNPTEEEIALLKRDKEEAKNTSYEMLKYNLEKASNGDRIHTVNKAKFHIDYMLKNKEYRFKISKKFDRLKELCFMVFCAIKYSSWKELDEWMSGMY